MSFNFPLFRELFDRLEAEVKVFAETVHECVCERETENTKVERKKEGKREYGI